MDYLGGSWSCPLLTSILGLHPVLSLGSLWDPVFSIFSFISWTPSLWQGSNEFCLGRLRTFELSYSRVCCCFVLFFPIFSSALWVPEWCDFPLNLSKYLLGWVLTTTPPMAAPLIPEVTTTSPCCLRPEHIKSVQSHLSGDWHVGKCRLIKPFWVSLEHLPKSWLRINLQLEWVSIIAVGEGVRVHVPPASEGGADATESQISPRREMGTSQKILISLAPKDLMGVTVPCLGLAPFHEHTCM